MTIKMKALQMTFLFYIVPQNTQGSGYSIFVSFILFILYLVSVVKKFIQRSIKSIETQGFLD